jgi:two-component system nitrogen regulation sensor histidine kinase NtrY
LGDKDSWPVPRTKGSSALPPAERRRRLREWRIAGLLGVLLVILAGVEQRLLAMAAELPIGRDTLFLVLTHLNVIGIGVLVFLCARNVVKLVIERRRGILGSHLNTKFVVAGVFMALVPTMGLFLFSALLIDRSIDTWFQLQVDEGLGESLEVANAYYRAAEENSVYYGRRIARGIERRRLLREGTLDQLRAYVGQRQSEYNLGVVEIFSAQKEELATATHPDVAVVAFEAPDSDFIQSGLSGVEGTQIQQAGPGELVRGIVPIRSTFNERDIVGVVVVNSFVPRNVSQQVATIRATLDGYRRLQPKRGAFKASLMLLLAMMTLSVLLFSSWLGFRLAKQVTVPIQRLAEATAEVAAGNLDVRIDYRAKDEIGMLVEGFNRMASDLATSGEDLERRRSQMEVMLRSIATGVISLDRDGSITSLNPSVLRLLAIPTGSWVGLKVNEVLSGPALETVEDLLRRLAIGPEETLRRQVTVPVGEEVRTLHWTASRLRQSEGLPVGFVVVIDDVTQILRVQRMVAWREVARRIAHEIKNPLTPIQLSAQRLRRKLDDSMPDAESREVLQRCTQSIITSVDAMKRLLSDFQNFSRLPATDPAPTDLNALVEETVSMYRENPTFEFITELDPKVGSLDLDQEQIKRIILNLIDNAMAAIEAAGEGPREIRVATRIDQSVGTVQLEVVDTGCGVRPEDRPRLFEPDFSTKRDGSGLGLAIVSRIISDHSGYIRVRDNEPRGTRFTIELPIRT